MGHLFEQQHAEASIPVATMTAQLGFKPLYLHLMFMNFSSPMSAPKPACIKVDKHWYATLATVRSGIVTVDKQRSALQHDKLRQMQQSM